MNHYFEQRICHRLSIKVLIKITRKQGGKQSVVLSPHHQRIWKSLVMLASGLAIQDGSLSPPGNSHLASGAIYIRRWDCWLFL